MRAKWVPRRRKDASRGTTRRTRRTEKGKEKGKEGTTAIMTSQRLARPERESPPRSPLRRRCWVTPLLLWRPLAGAGEVEVAVVGVVGGAVEVAGGGAGGDPQLRLSGRTMCRGWQPRLRSQKWSYPRLPPPWVRRRLHRRAPSRLQRTCPPPLRQHRPLSCRCVPCPRALCGTSFDPSRQPRSPSVVRGPCRQGPRSWRPTFIPGLLSTEPPAHRRPTCSCSASGLPPSVVRSRRVRATPPRVATPGGGCSPSVPHPHRSSTQKGCRQPCTPRWRFPSRLQTHSCAL